jgi:hypothetical protein
MSSSNSKDRLALSLRITARGHPSEIACDRCFQHNRLCISMPGFKCSECTRLGRKCTNMSFAALDNTIADCNRKMEEAMEEMSVAMAKYMRNKKIKSQAEERNKTRMLHMQRDLAVNDVEVEEDDCPAADATVGLSPAMWSAMAFMNDAVDVSRRDGTVAGSSGSS